MDWFIELIVLWTGLGSRGGGGKRALSLREFQIRMLGEYPYCSRSVENHVDFRK